MQTTEKKTGGRPDYKHKNADDAFDFAIDNGRLSAEKGAKNYAGLYMYMGTWGGRDTFKHINTREYLA